ncbi:hypothetical protein [Bdellovibrio svalbardensis]|uniref:Secreted protein n=1 Tax=Bdellovibrio svalbardensis TaxID=2972972 RepID=A0ABT6DFI9_9BACT|nr:hypothetical protein [Bdellovibrio svalbardensis]MDG0815592.1 hypothetical protein [Bdellovibrio svalbardensis]
MKVLITIFFLLTSIHAHKQTIPAIEILLGAPAILLLKLLNGAQLWAIHQATFLICRSQMALGKPPKKPFLKPVLYLRTEKSTSVEEVTREY